MSQYSTEYKTIESGHGAVPFQGIAEYTSRLCRQRLAVEIFRAIEYEIQVNKNECRRNGFPVNRSYTACNEMARLLGVTRRTVRRWRNGGFQSCDFNANKLVTIAFKKIPEKTARILENDLDRHWQEYFAALAKNGQGAVLSQNRRWV